MLHRGNECLCPVALPFVSGSSLPLFRCGKCPACLKHKGSQLAVRLFREVQCCSDVFFLTFTYRNEDLPISSFSYCVNLDTGEVEWCSPSRVERDPYLDFYERCPGEYVSKRKGVRSKRCFPFDEVISSYCGVEYHRVKYWTVYSKDIQDTLKRFRHLCGKKFKYFLVPEYGGLTYRPHVHMCCVGLKRKDVSLLVKEWKFGHVDVREVSASAPDRSSQLAKLSAYVSKYASKGKYDCPFILQGYCCRPRVCSSIRFGFGSESMYESLKRFLLAEDVFGEYDYKHIDPTDDMVKVISGRRYVDVNGYKYPLPRLFVDEFFKQRKLIYRPISKRTGYVVKSCKSTPLQSKVASFVLGRIVQDSQREFEDLLKESENLGSSPLELYSVLEHDFEVRRKSIEDAFISDLLNSYF